MNCPAHRRCTNSTPTRSASSRSGSCGPARPRDSTLGGDTILSVTISVANFRNGFLSSPRDAGNISTRNSVDSLVEKHLDFERFCRTSHYPDRMAPRDWETAFWLAMMAGAKTYAHCIDLDSHDIIGWNPVPTRWHESKTGWVAGPYSYRYLPVVRPSLRFFQIAKVIYDHFPNRIWSFSSANCGLAVWEIYSSPKFNHNVFPAVEQRLQAAGLNGVEHYPRPPRSPGSLGKCHRRPCGMDSGIITCNGVIADPIEQIRAFMNPPPTPPFETILAIYWERLEAMYGLFLSQGESPQHTHLTKDEKQSLVESCQQVIASVKEWSRGGYILDWDLINNEVSHSNEEPEEQDEIESLVQPPESTGATARNSAS